MWRFALNAITLAKAVHHQVVARLVTAHYREFTRQVLIVHVRRDILMMGLMPNARYVITRVRNASGHRHNARHVH